MRSLFSKLLGTQVILLVIIFLTLILASTYLLEHYFHEAKQREVLANADKLVRKIQELEFQTNQGSNVNTLLQTFSEFTGMNAWIVDQGGTILFVAGDSSEVDAPSFRDDWNVIRNGDKMIRRQRNETSPRPVLNVAIPVLELGQFSGAIYVQAPLIGVNSTIRGVRRMLLFAGLAAITLAFSVSYVMARKISAPLSRLTAAVGKMSDGRFDVRVTTKQSDEIDNLSRAFNNLAAQLNDTISRLRHESKKVATVLTSMGDGVVVVDNSGDIDLWNDAASNFLNVQSDSQETEVSFQQDEIPLLFQKVLNTTCHIEQDVFQNGRQYTLKLSPMLDNNQAALGVVGVFRDTSERRDLERMRREFVANVSHELRTPLTSIKGFLEAVVDGVADGPKEVEEYLRIAIDETERMRRMALTLLDLTSIEQGVIRLNRESVHIRGMIVRALDKLTPQIQRKNLRVKVNIEEGLSLVYVDPDKIGQVLLNLIDNAIQFSPRESEIGVSVVNVFERNAIRVMVRDSGPGLPESEYEQVWERFYRRDPSRQSKTGGAGLGLSIVRELVEAHGGAVGITPSKDSGCIFYFLVPISM